MITTIVLLSILLFLSILLNIIIAWFSYWYVKEAVQEILVTSTFIEDAKDVLSSYLEHLNAIHELEMFYGDETLKSLIMHGTSIVEYFDNFDNPLVFEEKEEDEENE
jgi:hypothetical protein